MRCTFYHFISTSSDNLFHHYWIFGDSNNNFIHKKPFQLQYSKVEEFLRDLRKMFKNCYKFHPSHTEYHRYSKHLEETLDKRLEEWLPKFAYDQTVSSLPAVGAGPAAKKSKR